MGASNHLTCPKCGSDEIHVWLKCICYNCGQDGDIAYFGGTPGQVNAQKEFYRLLWRKRTSE